MKKTINNKKLFTQAAGIIFLAIGILSLVPGIVSSEGLLLGILQVKPLTQNLIHLLAGILALMAVYSSKDYYLNIYVKVFTIIFSVFAVWGLPGLRVGLTDSIGASFGLIRVNLATELLYIFVVALGVIVGFFDKRISDSEV